MKKSISIGFHLGLLDLSVSLLTLYLLAITGLGKKLPAVVHKNEITLVAFITIGILVPLVEEIIFRLGPIRITQCLTSKSYILWTVIILVSALFGVLHGSVYNIFLQGVSGVIFSIAFLRGGYVASVVAHMTTNGIVLTSILLFYS